MIKRMKTGRRRPNTASMESWGTKVGRAGEAGRAAPSALQHRGGPRLLQLRHLSTNGTQIGRFVAGTVPPSPEPPGSAALFMTRRCAAKRRCGEARRAPAAPPKRSSDRSLRAQGSGSWKLEAGPWTRTWPRLKRQEHFKTVSPHFPVGV